MGTSYRTERQEESKRFASARVPRDDLRHARSDNCDTSGGVEEKPDNTRHQQEEHSEEKENREVKPESRVPLTRPPTGGRHRLSSHDALGENATGS